MYLNDKSAENGTSIGTVEIGGSVDRPLYKTPLDGSDKSRAEVTKDPGDERTSNGAKIATVRR